MGFGGTGWEGCRISKKPIMELFSCLGCSEGFRDTCMYLVEMEVLEYLKEKGCLFLVIYKFHSEEFHCTFLDQHNFPPSPIWHSLNTHSLSAVSPFLSHSSTICSTCFPINSWLGLSSPALSLSVSGLHAGAIRKASQNFLWKMDSDGKTSRGVWEVSRGVRT